MILFGKQLTFASAYILNNFRSNSISRGIWHEGFTLHSLQNGMDEKMTRDRNIQAHVVICEV
jgi:hypothetical protein